MAKQEGFPTANPDTLLHEPNYRIYVLQLLEKMEEEQLTALRRKALDIGLTIKHDSEKSNGRLEIASEPSESSTPTPSTLMSPSQVTIPSSVSSSTQRLPSAHSVSSLATCPTTCNEGKTHQKLPIFSPAPSRHSFDTSYCQEHLALGSRYYPDSLILRNGYPFPVPYHPNPHLLLALHRYFDKIIR